jgi:acyl-CoA thioesterase
MTALNHSFDRALALDVMAADRVRGATTPEWANMVGPFGGVTAAVLLRAVEQHPERLGEPVALTVNFAAPIADGTFDVVTRLVRINRTNQHWAIDLWQDEAIKTSATAVFGTRRDTWSDTERTPPAVPGPDEAPPSAGAAPSTKRIYEMRFVEGAAPADGAGPAAESTTTLWVRDRDGRALDFAALAALSDVFYPRVYLRRGRFSPAGTITLTTYFHTDGDDLAATGGDFVLARAAANTFSRGYFDQFAELWSGDGRLLVTTHQLVYFKD